MKYIMFPLFISEGYPYAVGHVDEQPIASWRY